MINLSSKIFRVLPYRLRSLYDGLSIPHRIFIKEHVLIRPVTVNGRRHFAHRALGYDEYFYKYKDAIEEAKKLAIEKGLDPQYIQSSVCPTCQIPMIWKEPEVIPSEILQARHTLSQLLCLKCGRID